MDGRSPSNEADLILRRIGQFPARCKPADVWLIPIVERYKFLPLYFGWFSILGIAHDGTFVRWDIDDEKLSIVTNAYLQRLTIYSGIDAYPELKQLVAVRPAAAVVCDTCSGTGKLPGAPTNLICKCCGAGWLVPGEDQGISPG